MVFPAGGARQRRSGGGPRGGCARRPVGTYLYLHAVGANNPVAVEGGGSSRTVTRLDTMIGLTGYRTRDLSCIRRALYRGVGKE